jgi:hypothetical protein
MLREKEKKKQELGRLNLTGNYRTGHSTWSSLTCSRQNKHTEKERKKERI